MPNPRLILADDHEILLDGLKRLLSGEFDVIGTASDGTQLLELCRTLQPEVVVTDIGMPGLSGMSVAEALTREKSKARLIFLTMQSEVDLVVRAFHHGVAGYVMKHAASIELVTAIREVLAGRTFISPRISGDLVACLGPNGRLQRKMTPEAFTTRQIEVLRLIARGKTMKEVAATLDISTRTAEAHKYKMMEQHGIHTVAELIRMGIEHGVI
jgi:DNA-binding NarL/FixJ family response regulator